MSQRTLSSLDLRAFFRLCHQLLQDEVNEGSWTALQKFFLLSGQSDFGLFIRELKKLDPAVLRQMTDGFSNGQLESKLWLLEVLSHVLPERPDQVYVLGSWFGLLPRLWSWLDPQAGAFHLCDLEARWKAVAEKLNQFSAPRGGVFASVGDMCELDYSDILKREPRTLFVNTSCEHLGDFQAWRRRLPPGALVALQASNAKDHEGHQHIWSSLAEFDKDVDLETVLFSGSLELFGYRRMMLIGVLK